MKIVEALKRSPPRSLITRYLDAHPDEVFLATDLMTTLGCTKSQLSAIPKGSVYTSNTRGTRLFGCPAAIATLKRKLQVVP